MKTVNNFDNVAPVYDVLAGVVFGNSIIRAQLFYLKEIPAYAHILILGGGTGKVACALLQLNTTCQIVYVEASAAMLESARSKIGLNDRSRVRFVHSSEVLSNETFDVVITQFFLDLFPVSKLEGIVKSIRQMLKPGGAWIITDFVDNGKWWQRAMLWIMYRFFRITTNIEAASLPPWQGMTARDSHGLKFADFYGGFIRSMMARYGA